MVRETPKPTFLHSPHTPAMRHTGDATGSKRKPATPAWQTGRASWRRRPIGQRKPGVWETRQEAGQPLLEASLCLDFGAPLPPTTTLPEIPRGPDCTSHKAPGLDFTFLRTQSFSPARPPPLEEGSRILLASGHPARCPAHRRPCECWWPVSVVGAAPPGASSRDKAPTAPCCPFRHPSPASRPQHLPITAGK